MTRRVPVLATLVVLLAVAMMIALGVWQLHRRQEKAALLARYAAAIDTPAEVAWPGEGKDAQDLLYRRTRLTCTAVTRHSSIAGRNRRGEAGMAQTAQCTLSDGGRALVVMGWSRLPNAATAWQGGPVSGMIAPGPRLVADPPLAGLQPNALPDPADIPNNHLSYAIQWFLFALTALVIYAVALRRRSAA